MIDPITNEEIVEETGDELTEEEQKAADEAKAAEDAKKVEEDKKEEARKAFELRQQKKAEKGVSREEFDEVKKTVSSITEENKDLKFRNDHPGITDEEFNSIKAHGPDYEKTLEDPVFKNYFKDKDTKTRVDGATPPPSTKTGQVNSGQNDWANMPSDEFRQKKNQVLTKRSG